ncbi:hypothetical protein OG462_41760 [Streptomyces sp. NBC_01077]|uniref:hypothetical protein n=1 Tax=Streptomyces sp. NBC_01077 TaxID=2903746 RepID=UPI0038658EDB|nr:hypothetical protein OG462_03260 [Streptomyces sp. NBC_01077]WSV43411.1 hypothetical protein OG462_41760 [Streptomyces sp. NBC_01077]
MKHTIGRCGRAVLGRLLPVLALGGLLCAALTEPAHAEPPGGGRGERPLAEINLPAGRRAVIPCLEHPSNCRSTTDGR